MSKSYKYDPDNQQLNKAKHKQMKQQRQVKKLLRQGVE